VLLGVRERIEALQRRYPRHLSAGGEDALVVGKGMGEDATNGAAARPVVPAREGRATTEQVLDCALNVASAPPQRRDVPVEFIETHLV